MRAKKVLIIAALLICNGIYAQRISATKVPDKVVAAFKAKFGDATKIKWEREHTNEYEASFRKDGKEFSANFDMEGKWLETEIEIETSALPGEIKAALKKDFALYKVTEASKIESDKSGSCYEAEVKKGSEHLDLLFNAQGVLQSKSKAD